MKESKLDKHYEERFEFPLWKLIKQRAEAKDISYHDASIEVLPEYQKTIRYRDKDFEEPLIKKLYEEVTKVSEVQKRLDKILKGENDGS